MKLLEVEGVQSGIDYTVKDIDNLREQIGNVQKAVRNFYLLDDSLKGEGGEALRAFYRDCHEPYLILLHQSMIDYQNILTQMSEAIDSFESSESGYVKQGYIENDVEDGLEHVKDTAIKYTDEANSIIDSVSDIVSITPIDESNLVDEVQKGKKNAEEIVEELYALDAEQVKALASVKEDLNDMRNFISDLETLFEDGDLSVENYSINTVRGLESFRSIYEGVYGEGSIIDESLQVILDKLENGEGLTDLETAELYDYIQDVILDDETIKDLENLISMIGEDSDRLIDRLNNKVLATEDSLNYEIAIVEAYIFGVNSESEEKLAIRDVAGLKGYLATLYNYKDAIDELNEEVDFEIGGPGKPLLAQVAELKHWQEGNPYAIHFETDIAINITDDVTREEFLNAENLLLVRLNESSVSYYMGEDADMGLQEDIIEKLKEEDATFIENTVGKEVVQVLIGGIKKWGTPISSLITWAETLEEKKEREREVQIGEAHKTAMALDMEIEIIERYVPREGDKYHIGLEPTHLTFEIIERWGEVYSKNSEIPYPSDAIKENNYDWYKITKSMSENQEEIRGEFSDELYTYIFRGHLEEGKTVDDIVKKTH